ncbi:uncharacterized protein At4g18490-like isoform X2 [Rutidosis leptorrhynchoides]|uniref:uncharacterized protein At4g18490-like isoform X2 n=1 Tax=Rutidosis leptorrhynchoides TaxID=125765 RepID=UPI003A99E6BF
MAESQKTEAPVKPKEKDSLLDLDIDKDFLGSWKSMSMGDDGMDFDFGPSTSGNKKAFKFDKLDMDFSIDADFGKLPSFKMDMPSLDIASPTKKSETSKERSKEELSGGGNRAKSDSFAFSFDFDEFAGLDFGPKKTKNDENFNKSKDKEGISNSSGSGDSGDLSAKHNDSPDDDDIAVKRSASRAVSISEVNTQMESVKASESKHVDASEDDDTSLKHSATKGASVSNIDTQIENIKDPDSRNEDVHLKSVGDERRPLKPDNAKEQGVQKKTSSEKLMSCNLQEPIQESHSSDMKSSPEPHVQKTSQDLHENSLTDNVTAESMVSDVQEEESGTRYRMMSLSTRDEQNDNVRPLAELTPTSSLSLENLSVDMKSQREGVLMYEERDDNVTVGHIDIDDTNKAVSHVESSLISGRQILTPAEMNDKRNENHISKPLTDARDSRSTIDEVALEKEKRNIPVRSKYFKKQTESDFEAHQSSKVISTKLISVGNKRMNTLLSNPPFETGSDRGFQQASISSTKVISIGNKRMDTLLKNTPIEKRCVESRSLPKMLSRDIPVQTELTETGHCKALPNTSECLNADNQETRNEPTPTTVAKDIDPKKKEHVPMGDENTESISALRSDVHPSSSMEQSNKALLHNSQNPGVQVKRTKSTNIMSKNDVGKNRTSPTQADMRISEVDTPKVSRATEKNLKPLNSMLPKGLTSVRNKDQVMELQVNMSKKNLPVDMNKQTPLTPTLKRKSFEGSSETPKLNPLKRVASSPYSHNITSSSEKAVEEQLRKHSSVVTEKSPRLAVSLTEMDISSEIENDSNFEKVEACSKELDDVCNMLKKKHEEAKDVLGRAIVNNNSLLMLNHPIHQDKIRMIQKFAAMLISK